MNTDRFSWLRLLAYGALLLLCLAFYSRAEAQTAVTPYISAQPQFLDAVGNPLASGCVFTYAAGTSTPQATYTDSTGTTPNANPIILNAAGYAPSAIWFTTSAYKIQVKSFGGSACASGSTIRTEDSLQQKYFRYDGANVLTPIADLSASLGEFWLSSTNAGFLKWSDASAIHTVVGADNTQTLTNKTYSAGIFTGTETHSGQIQSSLATGTPPFQVASTTPVANLTAVPATYNIGGTQLTATHIVVGSCTLGTDCSITLVGSAIFTGTTTYFCAVTDITAAAAVRLIKTSGSAFSFTGTGTDAMNFVCAGN